MHYFSLMFLSSNTIIFLVTISIFGPTSLSDLFRGLRGKKAYVIIIFLVFNSISQLSQLVSCKFHDLITTLFHNIRRTRAFQFFSHLDQCQILFYKDHDKYHVIQTFWWFYESRTRHKIKITEILSFLSQLNLLELSYLFLSILIFAWRI